MTVGELREELSRWPDTHEVQFGYTGSDYWKTPIARDVVHVEELEVIHDEYHGHNKILAEDREHDEDEEETKFVVVLSDMRLP